MDEFQFQAEAVDIRASESQTASVNITLYTGGVMTVGGVGPVLIDLAGMEFPDSLPILVDHNLSVSTTLGQGQATVINGQLYVQGVVSKAGENFRQILSLKQLGLNIQASGGWKTLEMRQVREGEQVNANNRTVTASKGGFKLITKSRLYEASICTLGADPQTSVNIAASRARKANMNFDQFVIQAGFDPQTLNATQRASLQVAYDAQRGGGGVLTADDQEVNRVNAIHAACFGDRGQFPDIEARAVEENWSVRQARVEVIRASRAESGPANTRGDLFTNRGQVIEASMLLSQGVPESFVGEHYDERTINAAMARENRGMTLHGVLNGVLREAGRSTGWRRIDSDVLAEAFEANRVIQASGGGFSTLSLPGSLGNVANKILLNTFQSIVTTWQTFCGITIAPNFKPFSSYDITADGSIKEVGEDGVLKHISLHETAYPQRVKTRGAFIQITEEQFINDDMGVFSAISRQFARMSAVGLDKACYKCLMDNLGTIFTSGRGNYFEGADSGLSITTLGTAEQKFLDQVDSNGDPLLIMPSILSVPTTLSASSAVITRNTSVQQPTSITTATSTGNPHGDKFKPVVAPWLNNDGMQGASDDHWFLFGTAPETGVIVVAFLNGQQQPTVEQGQVDFATLGMAWRVVYRFGVAIGDYRFGVRSKGKA